MCQGIRSRSQSEITLYAAGVQKRIQAYGSQTKQNIWVCGRRTPACGGKVRLAVSRNRKHIPVKRETPKTNKTVLELSCRWEAPTSAKQVGVLHTINSTTETASNFYLPISPSPHFPISPPALSSQLDVDQLTNAGATKKLYPW